MRKKEPSRKKRGAARKLALGNASGKGGQTAAALLAAAAIADEVNARTNGASSASAEKTTAPAGARSEDRQYSDQGELRAYPPATDLTQVSGRASEDNGNSAVDLSNLKKAGLVAQAQGFAQQGTQSSQADGTPATHGDGVAPLGRPVSLTADAINPNAAEETIALTSFSIAADAPLGISGSIVEANLHSLLVAQAQPAVSVTQAAITVAAAVGSNALTEAAAAPGAGLATGTTVAGAPAPGGIGVDQFDVQDNSVLITETEAGALIEAGLAFAESDVVSEQAEGTQVSTSLKDLQKLGVDTVLVDAIAAADAGHDIVLDLGAGTLNPTQIPQFAGAADVELKITDAQVQEAAGLALALKDAGIDFVGAADGSLALSFTDVEAIINAGLEFERQDSVVTQLTDADLVPALDLAASFVAREVNPGIDQIDMLDDSATISATEAATLVEAGLQFVESDDVSVQAEGTQLSTSLKELQQLGVDHVAEDAAAAVAAAAAGRDIVLDLGFTPSSTEPGAQLLALLESFPAPLFDANAQVELVLPDQSTFDAIGNSPESADIVTKLVDLGVDYVKILGTDIDHDLNNP